MIQLIKKSVLLLLLITVFTSCNQEPTLQTYYVDNELEPGFASYDIPTSVVNVEGIDMTEEQKEAYNSVDKLNVLTYMVDNTDTEDYKLELEKVNTILKNPKYEELMRGGNTTDGKFVVKFMGDIDNIDELIIFGSANNKGFAIARILGDDMNTAQLMSLSSVLEKANFDKDQLKGITDFFK